MPWTAIPTVSDTDVLDEADLAAYLSNLEYLHTALVASYYDAGGTDFTKTGTTWGALSANYQLSLATQGERVLVVAGVVAARAQFDVRVDGTRLGSAPDTTGEGSFGVNETGGASASRWVFPFATILDLAAGTHTFDMEWKAAGGTATVYRDFKPWFMVRALKL